MTQEVQAIQSDKLVSSLIALATVSYENVKGRTLQTRFLGSAVEAPLKFIEGKVDQVQKLNPYDTNAVIKGLDERLAGYIKYGEEKKDVAIKYGEEKKDSLIKYSEEKKEEVMKFGEEKLTQVREVPLVSAVESKVTVTVDKVLSISEELIESKLPALEDEEKEEEVEGESYVQAKRALRLSKVATRRFRAKVLGNIPELKLRERIVEHVDLMKYSEYLDLEKVKGKSFELKDMVVHNVEQFPTLVKAQVENAKAAALEIKPAVERRTEELKALAAKYREAVQARIPKDNQVYRMYETASQTATDIVETFRAEVEKQRKRKEEEKDPEEPLTIEDGLRAIAAAAKIRFDSVSQSVKEKFQNNEAKKED